LKINHKGVVFVNIIKEHNDKFFRCGATLTSHRLSFANITFITDHLVEVIVDKDVVISIEMIEEFDALLSSSEHPYLGVLINRIHSYSYSFEAQFCLYSHYKMKAIALVYYSPQCRQSTEDILALRFMDKLNLKMFAGLELGWQQSLDWLQEELYIEGDFFK